MLVVAITALVLGVPLAVSTWQLVEDFTRANLVSHLEQIGRSLAADPSMETARIQGIELAVPPGAQLVLEQPGRPPTRIGADPGPDPVMEAQVYGTTGTMTLAERRSDMRGQQLQLSGVVLLLVLVSVGAGAVVASVTARRLVGPVEEVAARAARLGAGDFRPVPTRTGVAELDRVSDVLDSSASALAELVQRERELLGDVSHQLRSRLTALQLRLDELAAHPDPDVRRESTAALDQTERLAAVLDELLDAARQARAAGATPVELSAGLDAVAREWRPAVRAAGRTLRLKIPEGLLARATPARLREAVGALVDNALRHGGGTITVSARLGEGTVVIEVNDNGPGVPAELAPHVFDRGVSGDSSTGLGLALARALVEADGGRLELSRARPATFAIFLPVPKADQVTEAARPVGGPR
jgi:signal transduction histidine kinase